MPTTARHGLRQRLTNAFAGVQRRLLRSDRPPVVVSARTRIVGWFMLLLLLAGLTSIVVVRQVLLLRVDERVEEQLRQEAAELEALAGGTDPETAEPFGTDVEALFRVHLRRNLPGRAETFLAFTGANVYPAVGRRAAELQEDDTLLRRFASIEQPQRGQVEAGEQGTAEYLAIPLMGPEGETLGVFAVFQFRAPLVEEVDAVTRLMAGVGIVLLVVASSVVWGIANRLLAPVRSLTSAARSISESDLDRRIEVTGDDELAQLATTFNAMLDRLETAFQSQRSFVDDAGHELRTPITIIRGHLELMGDDPADREEALAIVEDELARMSRFVEDLLVLAKSQRPDFLAFDTVDVATLSGELAAKMRALAARDWRVEATGHGRVVADRQRLTQAVMQLAANATQHTGEGDTIGLGTAVRDGELRVWVRDTGAGVPRHEQDRIFDRFARSKDAPRRSEGAGLGLSIVRAIAEAHHGSVGVTSRLGEGATFTLRLPVDQPDPDDATAEEQPR